MKWRRCPCGCGRLIGDDERFCRQRGEGYRAIMFGDRMPKADRALLEIFSAMIYGLEPEVAAGAEPAPTE
jgi:hypothetical protein